jgi:hypothetical protein
MVKCRKRSSCIFASGAIAFAVVPLLLGLAVRAQDLGESSNRRGAMTSVESNVSSQNCAARVKTFVVHLDELLASNPSHVSQVNELLDKYFPLTGCHIEEVISICHSSKFFSYASEQSGLYYAIAFDSRSNKIAYPGFTVGFSLLKKTGDSSHPFAKVNL